MPNPRDFLLNTDYEMDKIVFFHEGSLGVNENADIPHNLPFTPLVFGVCAFNADFSDARTIPYEQITQANTIQFETYADSTKIHVDFTNFESSPARVYYRIYAFEPSNSAADVPYTSPYARQFILNTDYNYCKLKQTGVANGNTSTTIPHGLGYLPMVMVWSEKDGQIKPEVTNFWNDPYSNLPFGTLVTEAAVTFEYSDTGNNLIHYRIYYDEA